MSVAIPSTEAVSSSLEWAELRYQIQPHLYVGHCTSINLKGVILLIIGGLKGPTLTNHVSRTYPVNIPSTDRPRQFLLN